MANLLSGEIGIIIEGREYIFRPSLYALSKIGDTPEEIAGAFHAIQTVDEIGFGYALRFLACCCNEDVTHLTGYHRLVNVKVNDIVGVRREPRIRFVSGLIDPQNIHVLAAKLMINAMCGDGKSKDSNKKLESFDPCEYVGMAVAHLGLSINDAWNITMHELQSALRAKYPEPKKDEITEEQMAYYEKALAEENSNG